MTVTGALSAGIAPTPYVPPFQYVTSTKAAPLVTGTATGGEWGLVRADPRGGSDVVCSS
jgi:hypothetical protein